MESCKPCRLILQVCLRIGRLSMSLIPSRIAWASSTRRQDYEECVHCLDALSSTH